MLAYACVCVLWIAFNAMVVSGNYLFVLQLNSFENPSNATANGSCCACCETEDSCSSSCDIGLRICLRPAGFNQSDLSCPFLELYGDDRPRVGNWAVSGPWPGSVQLYIRTTHTVGDPDRQPQLADDILIDNLYIEIENLTSLSPPSPAEVFTGDGGRVESELQFQVNCDGNWYGPFCDVECRGRNDSGGHYLCNGEGVRECLEGYQNLETNCTECAPADGCMNGYCDGPLSCVCLDGYSGEHCDLAPTSAGKLQTSTTAKVVASTPAPRLTTDHIMSSTPLAVETPSFSLTPSLTGENEPKSTSPVPILLPTVGGVAPRPDSTSTRWSFYLTATVVASVGGLLLLLMVFMGTTALCLAAKRGRRRKYEISTSRMPGRNGSVHHYDENRLLESITPTSSEIENDSEITFTTFRNGNTPPQQQPLRHELHVYYHRNTPEPPSSSRLAGEDGMGTDSVEMEFPSGYTDSRPEDENECYLQWSSARSAKGDHPLAKGGESGAGAITTATGGGLHTTFNEYQLN